MFEASCSAHEVCNSHILLLSQGFGLIFTGVQGGQPVPQRYLASVVEYEMFSVSVFFTGIQGLSSKPSAASLFSDVHKIS